MTTGVRPGSPSRPPSRSPAKSGSAPAAYGLSGEGFVYTIKNLDLVLGGRDAISNELVESPATIRFDSGAFLVYLQDDGE